MADSPTTVGLDWPRSDSAGQIRRVLRAYGPWLAIIGAVVVAVALRAPWFSTPLANDEAGLTFVSAHAHGGGPFEYGSYFIDRPPLLLGVFHLAGELGGTAAVRTFGALAAALLVMLIALVARELAGARAAIAAAFIAAVLASSPALSSVLTPAELLAALPATASVLALLVGLRLPGRRQLICVGVAGCLAIAALLVKQSFGDALLAGVAYCMAGLWSDRLQRRSWMGLAAAYLCGAALAVLGLEVWEHLYGVPDGTASYALLGFRVDGLAVLSGSVGDVVGRLHDRLLDPALASGLMAAAIAAGFGFRRLSGRTVIQATIAAWAAGGTVAILLGGSYWPHYLIQLVPVLAATAGVALAVASGLVQRLAAVALAALAVAGPSLAPALGITSHGAEEGLDIGSYVRARAHPDDSIYVLYSEPNVMYYSALRTPFPYEWSLMMRAVPGAQHKLRHLLESHARPTWVVEWESPSAYGLDADGRTAELLKSGYRRVASICDRPVLLHTGTHRPAKQAMPTCS